jgi:hypothetical protein
VSFGTPMTFAGSFERLIFDYVTSGLSSGATLIKRGLFGTTGYWPPMESLLMVCLEGGLCRVGLLISVFVRCPLPGTPLVSSAFDAYPADS